MSARAAALRALERVQRDAAFADQALDTISQRSKLEARESGLAQHLLFGTLRHATFVEHVLKQHLKRKLKDARPQERRVLVLATFELIGSRTPAYAAVSEWVGLAPGRARGFVNGVLRNVARDVEAGGPNPPYSGQPDFMDMARATSHPAWLLEEVATLRDMAGTLRWAQANNLTPDICARVRGEATRDETVQVLRDQGLWAEPVFDTNNALWFRSSGRVADLPIFASGNIAIQDLAAQWVGSLVPLTSGARVLDVCAAPGGKALFAADQVGPTGHVVGLDVHPGRVQRMENEATRLNVENLSVHVTDATDETQMNEALEDAEFDHVLVDAPCSGSGTLCRNPELRYRSRPEIPELVARQQKLLQNAAVRVRTGGTLTYSVCSVRPIEAEDQAHWFETSFPEFERRPATGVPLRAHGPLEGSMRTWRDVHNADGFFAISWTRTRR